MGREKVATNESVAWFPAQFFTEERDNGLESIRSCNLVEILLHDGSAADSLEANDDCGITQRVVQSAATLYAPLVLSCRGNPVEIGVVLPESTIVVILRNRK